MKLKYIAGIFTLFMALSLIFTTFMFNTKSYNKIDILDINNKVVEIKEKIETSNIEEIENEYQCQIIYLNDEYYSAVLNDAYKSNSIIIDYTKNGVIIGKFIFSNQESIYLEAQQKTKISVLIILSISSLFSYALLGLIYIKYLRPFRKLEKFANNIAKGDLYSPLLVHKEDYFGAFSEAFDGMREALKKAKEGEYQANKSKKELIAGLSHDKKPPFLLLMLFVNY